LTFSIFDYINLINSLNKLFSIVFGLLLLVYIAEEVITSFDLIEVSESIEKEMESDESDSDEKEEELQFAKFFIDDDFDFNIQTESSINQIRIYPIKSIGKPLSSLSNPPYSPPDIN
jgi:hypothetical protein